MKLRDILKSLGKYGGSVLMGMSTEQYFRSLRKDLVVDPALVEIIDNNNRLRSLVENQRDYVIENEVITYKVANEVEVGRRSMEKIQEHAKEISKVKESLNDPTILDSVKTTLESKLNSINSEIVSENSIVNKSFHDVLDIIKSSVSDTSSIVPEIRVVDTPIPEIQVVATPISVPASGNVYSNCTSK